MRKKVVIVKNLYQFLHALGLARGRRIPKDSLVISARLSAEKRTGLVGGRGQGSPYGRYLGKPRRTSRDSERGRKA